MSRVEKTPILNLASLEGTRINLTLQGGRSVSGVLAGHDKLQNLVLDEAVEGARSLGLVVVRSTCLQSVGPCVQEIDNPFQ